MRLFSFVFWFLEAHGRAPSPAFEAEHGCEACKSAVGGLILCLGKRIFGGRHKA